MKDSSIKAVHDDDLVQLLISLGCYDKVRAGECNCHFCGKPVTMESIGSIIPFNNQILFSCNSPDCLRGLIEMGEDEDVN